MQSFLLNVSFLYFLFSLFLGVASLLNLIFILVIYILSFLKVKKYPEFQPKISVIIPTFNEESAISSSLNSVFGSDYNMKKIEVIVADDGSSDKTKEIVEKYSRKYKNLRLLSLQHRGKSPTLNSALAKSKYDIILSLDADMILEKDFIKNIVLPFKNPDVGYSFGLVNIYLKSGGGILEHYQALEFYYMNLVRSSTLAFLSFPLWFSGPCACYRKLSIEKAGGFGSDTMTEDFDISLKLFKLGVKSAFVKNAVAYTIPIKSFKRLIKQRMRWFYGGIQNLIKHRSLYKTGSIAVIYIFFSYTLWFLNSVIIFPRLVSVLIISTWNRSLNNFDLIINSVTFTGTVRFLYTLFNQRVLDIFFYIYGLIGTVLLILYILSIIMIGKRISLQMFFSLFTYFFYLTFLQGCLIFSFIYYPLSGIKSFERK